MQPTTRQKCNVIHTTWVNSHSMERLWGGYIIRPITVSNRTICSVGNVFCLGSMLRTTAASQMLLNKGLAIW